MTPPQTRLANRPIASRFVKLILPLFVVIPLRDLPGPSVHVISTDGPSNSPPCRALLRRGTKSLEPTSRRTNSTPNTRHVEHYCAKVQVFFRTNKPKNQSSTPYSPCRALLRQGAKFFRTNKPKNQFKIQYSPCRVLLRQGIRAFKTNKPKNQFNIFWV